MPKKRITPKNRGAALPETPAFSLSIIIPVYNEEDEIYPCLRRLQSLRKLGAEVIVVDGGSSDKTISLAKPLADQVIDSDKGRALQMNAGASKASHDWLLFLHADTQLPEGLPDLMLAWNFAPAVWGFFGVKVRNAPPLLRIVELFMNRRSYMSGISTGDQCQFVQRKVFEKIGGFAQLPIMEDIEISKRLKRVSRPLFVRAKVTTSGRKWQREGIVKTVLLMWRLRLAYFFGVSPSVLEKRYYHSQNK